MKYFQKLNRAIPSGTYTAGVLNAEFPDLRYFALEHDSEELHNLVDFLNPRQVQLVEVEAGAVLLPHFDYGIKTALNFYLRPSGGLTLFWDPLPGAEARRAKGREAEHLYNLDDCEYHSSFIAEPGDVYLMNVGKVHSVRMPQNLQTRQFIQLGWADAGLEDVFQMLN